MPYSIALTQSAPTLLAVIRDRVPPHELSRFVPAACGEVWNFLRVAGVKGGRHVAVYPEDGTVEVGAEVAAPFSSNDRVRCSQLPSGLVATTVHFGPYNRLRDAHSAVRDWMREQHHQTASISWEIYGHWQEDWNANPALIRTDIYHLLRAA